jgi:gas vesicle protein GvpL/GvpF
MAGGRFDATGWWVYAVVPADREVPSGVTGVAGSEPQVIEGAALAAVASRVPLDEFGEEPLRENLNDLAWLERTVRAHEAVIESVLTDGAVVPMRVCTIYHDEDQVRAMLESRAMVFADALARLADKAERGVKVVADRRVLEDQARARSEAARALEEDAAGKPAGAAYIARKKLAAIVRDEAERTLNDVVREAHARLEEWAVRSVILPAQNRELAGYRGDMVFNGAYLVEDERDEGFADVVADLQSRYGPLGFAFELTGPWPAYNFANELAAREAIG